MTDRSAHPYYLERRQEIRAELEAGMTAGRAEFTALLPSLPFDTILHETLRELDQMLPILPYAGGDGGRMTPFFRQGAGAIALGRALRGFGASPSTIGDLMRVVFLSKIYALRHEERHALGRKWLSSENQAYLREEAQRSELRRNPGDFVYRFVESEDAGPEGKSFAFGLDYLECGFCKMCQAAGDEDLLPHICAMDKESYGIRGVELQRSTTLAAGNDRCNFRFALSEETEPHNGESDKG